MLVQIYGFIAKHMLLWNHAFDAGDAHFYPYQVMFGCKMSNSFANLDGGSCCPEEFFKERLCLKLAVTSRGFRRGMVYLYIYEYASMYIYRIYLGTGARSLAF